MAKSRFTDDGIYALTDEGKTKTKTELEQLRKSIQEAKQLQEELKNLPFVPATVKGPMPEFPYIEQHIGVDEAKGKEVREKLDAVLEEIQKISIINYNRREHRFLIICKY